MTSEIAQGDNGSVCVALLGSLACKYLIDYQLATDLTALIYKHVLQTSNKEFPDEAGSQCFHFDFNFESISSHFLEPPCILLHSYVTYMGLSIQTKGRPINMCLFILRILAPQIR